MKMAVDEFFSTTDKSESDENCCSDKSDPIWLLSGPPSSGKTSLLFQFALNAASRSSREVVFICNRRKLEAKPPFLSQGIDPSAGIFQRIQLKYVDDEEGLKKYFAAFHLYSDHFPVAVIVDDFGDFFDGRSCQERYGNARGRDLAMVRVLALCRSAVNHANRTTPSKLLLSDTHQGDSPRLLFIYKRWISSMFIIQGTTGFAKHDLNTVRSTAVLILFYFWVSLMLVWNWNLTYHSVEGDGSGSYLLKNAIPSNGGSPLRKRIAKYSIALQYLIIEGITEEAEQ